MKKTLSSLLSLLLLPGLLLAQPNQSTQPLVFTNVTVIDATGVPAKPNMTVVITDDRIAALSKTGNIRLPKAARIIDATGKFLIPGLWDMHMHLSSLTDLAIPVLIVNGVTGVRDMGGDLTQISQWRRQIASGTRVGPRIVMAGPIVDGPRTEEAQYRLTVSNVIESRQAVASLKQHGVDLIKVYHFLSREAYFAIADEAKKQGLPFAGHVPNGISPEEASDAGQSSIEHLAILIQAYTALADKRGQSQKELTDEALAAYSGDKGTLLFQRFVKNGTWHVPTLVVARSFLFRTELATAPDPRRKYMAASAKQHWEKYNPVPQNLSAEVIAYRKLAFQKFLEIVGVMRREGVALMAGTDPPTRDVFPGFSLHDELELLVKAGLTPMEALQAATRNPAKFLGMLDKLGTVEKGKIADLVLLDANPLQHIGNTKKINAVVVGGQFLPKASLQKMLNEVEAAAHEK